MYSNIHSVKTIFITFASCKHVKLDLQLALGERTQARHITESKHC